jgi:hypothetical protein
LLCNAVNEERSAVTKAVKNHVKGGWDNRLAFKSCVCLCV